MHRSHWQGGNVGKKRALEEYEDLVEKDFKKLRGTYSSYCNAELYSRCTPLPSSPGPSCPPRPTPPHSCTTASARQHLCPAPRCCASGATLPLTPPCGGVLPQTLTRFAANVHEGSSEAAGNGACKRPWHKDGEFRRGARP